MTVESPPAFLQSGTYGAEQTRRAITSFLTRGSSVGSITGGLVSPNDCQLSPPGSGMSVIVSPGEVWVPGTTSTTQGGYYCRVSSSTTLSIAAADPTNPRIDTVIAQVQDAAYAGVTNSFQVAVVTGTPTAGATLANLNGHGSVPASSLVLGYVLVPNGASSIVSGDLDGVANLVTAGYDSGWEAITPGTGIINGGVFDGARLEGDRVFLRGNLNNNSGSTISTGVTIGTIPSGLRPLGSVFFSVAESNPAATVILQIASTGVMTLLTGSLPANAQVNLEGVSYCIPGQ